MFEYCRIYIGQKQPPRGVLQTLDTFGYTRTERVAEPGEMAFRGGVLDVFPSTFESPVRIEYQGSRVESIRRFNPLTLETLDHHNMVVVLPKKVHSRHTLEVPFESFIDVQEGDYVVHVQHGIGRYRGRTTIQGVKNKRLDAMIFEYAGGDRLYIPVDQIHLVQKYVSFGGKAPALHHLGGRAWERTKIRAYASAWNYAKDILDTHAKRLALPGFDFGPDHEWQKPFEESFPHRETGDQRTATDEVKNDMSRPHTMDRVLLGDVGFGKTEVAIRAAFKAVMAGKQVAVLVPTTILAYQHARTFEKRMADYPVRTEMLSRFQTAAEQAKIVQRTAAGQSDIVIGTHRMLSEDVRFKDLGLLVIDEEQRFGVKDKERLKRISAQVDVLVMSATPIPRTLYLSIVGARPMSLISTPPENRHPVETQVVEEDNASMQRWIRKELGRGGQVFVVHNRVRSIYRLAERLRKLVPEAKVEVGHGQLNDHELEAIMMAFIEGRIDVLVTTTIIESGIDIPNANTLIITQADTFGLAELYQLRGRVGRFDRKAYAYLVVPKGRVLTAEARKRMEVMVQHVDLGAGFHIAMEDLKIRGAGNILGTEQSGQVSAVGFDMYCRLLRESVKRIKATQEAEHPFEVLSSLRRQEAGVSGGKEKGVGWYASK